MVMGQCWTLGFSHIGGKFIVAKRYVEVVSLWGNLALLDFDQESGGGFAKDGMEVSGNTLGLRRGNLGCGCLKIDDQSKELQVRFVSVWPPVWSRKVFHNIRKECRAFLAMNGAIMYLNVLNG